jgi:deoxycytidine triphosphate deaminase
VILTHDVILKEIASGRLVIDPLELDQVGPASIDLHRGDEIRVMEGARRIDLDEAA